MRFDDKFLHLQLLIKFFSRGKTTSSDLVRRGLSQCVIVHTETGSPQTSWEPDVGGITLAPLARLSTLLLSPIEYDLMPRA